MTIFQRFYLDGKLHKTSKPSTIERARHYLDNIEREWSKDGPFPLTAPGAFDYNKMHSISRISIDELVIVNTAGKTLRFVNVVK